MTEKSTVQHVHVCKMICVDSTLADAEKCISHCNSPALIKGPHYARFDCTETPSKLTSLYTEFINLNGLMGSHFLTLKVLNF